MNGFCPYCKGKIEIKVGDRYIFNVSGLVVTVLDTGYYDVWLQNSIGDKFSLSQDTFIKDTRRILRG